MATNLSLASLRIVVNMDEREVGKLALVVVAAGAWLTFLLLWLEKSDSRPLLIVTAILVVGTVLVILRSRLRLVATVLREGRDRFRSTLQRILDNDTVRAWLGVPALGMAVLGVAGAVASATGRNIVALLIWGLLAVVGSSASWYLIAWHRRPEAVAKVEALQSESVLHFTEEDQEDPQRLEFQSIRRVHMTVTPEEGNHWRLGIEFSNDRTFSGWRYWFFHPLWHLTKNEGDPRLLVTTYTERAEHLGDKVAIEPYDGQPVQLEINVAPERISLQVVGNPGDVTTVPIKFHRVGRLFAWADDRPYRLAVRVRVE